MSHDELLAEIKREIKQCSCFPGNCEDENNRPWNALRAVVELHKPHNVVKDMCDACSGLDARDYPCSTILAIEKELR